MYHDKPTSYEELIENAKLSFNKEYEIEDIMIQAIDNTYNFDDWQWAIKECHLQLKSIYIKLGGDSRAKQQEIVASIPLPITF